MAVLRDMLAGVPEQKSVFCGTPRSDAQEAGELSDHAKSKIYYIGVHMPLSQYAGLRSMKIKLDINK